MATTTEYDLDTSGGLMPQILALIAPPPSESQPPAKEKLKKKEKDKSASSITSEKTSGSSGTSTNISNAVAVATAMSVDNEGSRRRARTQNRDTCDSCGECGSLLCCERCPAALHLGCLNPPLLEVPQGEWLCQVCQTATATSGVVATESSTVQPSSDPLELLIRASSATNPLEFHPRGLGYLPIFPGSDKGPQKILSRRTSAQKKIPEKLCFECSRGSRVSPLLCCDFCPLAYHLDCLNPPLASMPHATWICPNHPQHALDMFLKTTRSTERSELWERFKNMDREALKLEFLRMGARKNPPFRFKVKQPPRAKVPIPAGIQQQYEYPRNGTPFLTPYANLTTQKSPIDKPKQEEIDEWLSGLVAIQMALAEKVMEPTKIDDDLTINNNNNNNSRDAKLGGGGGDAVDNVEAVMEEMFGVAAAAKRKVLKESQNLPQKRNRIKHDEDLHAELDALLHHADATTLATLSKVEPKLIQLLALQRVHQLLQKGNEQRKQQPPEIKIKEEKEEEEEDSSAVQDSVAALEENLYITNDGTLQSRKKYVALKDLSGGVIVEECTTAASDKLAIKEVVQPPLVRARAALTPIGSSVLKPRPALMRYRSFTIGTSLDNDLCLLDYGSCNFVSPQHAVIFFDEPTQQYELLNYSKYGTVVDSVVYANDATQTRVPTQPSNGDPVTKGVREILKRKRGILTPANRDEDATRMAARHTSLPRNSAPCKCRLPRADVAGWEGSGFVYHCSLLEFGCLQFVFSVIDFAPSLAKQPAVTAADDVKKEAEEDEERIREEKKCKRKRDGKKEAKVKREEDEIVATGALKDEIVALVADTL